MFGPRFVTSKGKKGTHYQPKDVDYLLPADAEELANEIRSLCNNRHIFSGRWPQKLMESLGDLDFRIRQEAQR